MLALSGLCLVIYSSCENNNFRTPSLPRMLTGRRDDWEGTIYAGSACSEVRQAKDIFGCAQEEKLDLGGDWRRVSKDSMGLSLRVVVIVVRDILAFNKHLVTYPHPTSPLTCNHNQVK